VTVRVLIVDDTIGAREAIRHMIESAEMSVAGEAANGVEAVARYRELRPDLVTMDLVMPEMSGTEAAREILRLDPQARIVAVSGLSQPSVMAEAEEVGMVGFVPKPVDAAELVNEIRSALGG
jgi:two-component system, chemotaxis family, chemotaxis protein CheY